MGRLPVAFVRWPPRVVTVVAVILVSGVALTLASASQSATISGHVYYCDGGRGSAAARACAPGEPVAHATELFQLADGTRSFAASTDSTGAYSVSVVPGTYMAKWTVVGSARYHDAGRTYIGDWDVKPIAVRAGQHVVLDLTTHAFSQ